jgi:hypothetical protein
MERRLINTELVSIWEAVYVACFEVLSAHIDGATLDMQLVCRLRHKLRTPTKTRIHSRRVVNLYQVFRVVKFQECAHSSLLCCNCKAKFFILSESG